MKPHETKPPDAQAPALGTLEGAIMITPAEDATGDYSVRLLPDGMEFRVPTADAALRLAASVTHGTGVQLWSADGAGGVRLLYSAHGLTVQTTGEA